MSELPPGVELPLNLGLNDGTYCPQACIDVLKSFDHRLSLRSYTTPENDPVLAAIAEKDGVTPDHIYLANGSGPLLKQCIPHFIRTRIKASPARILRHLVSKNGYPIVTASFTYFKVPLKAAGLGLQTHLIPVTWEEGFRLSPDAIRQVLRRQDGLVYVANPNNPSGQLMLSREEIESLLQEFPDSLFWIDEAYVQYLDPADHQPVSDLVPRYPNLVVGRTFSFAYGLAGARIGYLLAAPEHVTTFRSHGTDYRLGVLQEALAIAAIRDEEHLPELRRICAEQRALLTEGMEAMGIEVFPSETNFLLCRFTDGRSGMELADKLDARGLHIKQFKALPGYTYEPYFRVTLGTEAENRLLLKWIGEILEG